MRGRWMLLGAVALAATLPLSGCGNDDDGGDSSSGGDSSETVATLTGAIGNVQKVQKATRLQAKQQRPAPTTAGLADSNLAIGQVQTIDQFMSAVLQNVQTYWNNAFAGANYSPLPGVFFNWLQPGAAVQTACNSTADDTTAAYCPYDDTIYIAQATASELWTGNLGPKQWQSGDFALAYAIAHEYAHNIQTELGRPQQRTAGRELQADCYAGTWANSAYYQGLIEPGDPEEAINTAFALGDDVGFATDDPHGSPEERAQAWLLGYNTANPQQCDPYFP